MVTLSTEEAARLLEACEDWQEGLCIATGLYTGARRGAMNRVRLRDVDFRAGTIRFREEKGGKPIVKPMPDEYVAILRAAEDYGVWASAEDYLIPNRRPAAVRRAERSDKVIWNTVTRVAVRVGLEVHVHALRGACAVRMDESKPGEIVGIKESSGMPGLKRHWCTCAGRTKRGRWNRSPADSPSALPRFRPKPKRRIRDSNPCRRRERAVS